MDNYTTIVLENIDLNKELKNYILFLQNRMMSQVRTSLCKLTGINSKEEVKIYKLCYVTESEFKSTAKEFPGLGKVITNPIYSAFLLIAVKASMVGESTFAEQVIITLGLLNLARLKYKYIQYCNPEIMETVFNGLSRKTYIGTNGIVWAIQKISLDSYNKFKNDIINSPNDPFWRSKCLIKIRHKFNQMMKRIAIRYYETLKTGDIDKQMEGNFRKLAEEITSNLISSTDAYDGPIKFMAKATKIDEDVYYNLQYNLQIDIGLREVIFPLIVSAIRKIYKIAKVHEDQNIELNINNEIFIRKLFTAYKKSNDYRDVKEKYDFSQKPYPIDALFMFIITIVCTKLNMSKLKLSNDDEKIDDAIIN